MVLAALVVFASHVAAQTAEEVAGEIEAVRESIAGLEQALAVQRAERSTVEAELARAEQAIGDATRRLRALEIDRRAAALRLRELETERTETSEALARQQDVLAEQLRAAYALGRQSRLKLWLSQGDPGRVARAIGYFDFIETARSERIRQVATQLERLAVLERETAATAGRLEALVRATGVEREERVAAREERSTALASLAADIARRGGELVALQEQQAQLEALLLEIQSAFADIPDALAGRDFATLTGELAWPAAGRLSARPGQTKAGLQTWGAIIAAEGGSPVSAIAPGRVAYADWLRGLGLLTIIDHGQGYLSLYAFNESLLRDVGDWVVTGEQIGVVGTSGGREEPALYFELRRDGQPVDPRPWFANGTPER
ncbi:MAG: peptidoglycan DD-metalloendopeptidase family protein [Pseudomonadota bacterium]